MKFKRSQLGSLFITLVFVYFGSYLAFRQTQMEVWHVDKSSYVIFPENKILYYMYRPLSMLDARLTGMKFHIGPHQ